MQRLTEHSVHKLNLRETIASYVTETNQHVIIATFVCYSTNDDIEIRFSAARVGLFTLRVAQASSLKAPRIPTYSTPASTHWFINARKCVITRTDRLVR